ncbi:rhodanese-like domain-containing protein [Shouchella patagoniensis]|uniref:rhodanese-like domain-containing protein n=1 Tax=Shouchella patagoniensis TaxID=228576 RepID=UPI00099551DA|nr:rhodanese-like domain-containing protein [Shouchella patagoniensis]
MSRSEEGIVQIPTDELKTILINDADEPIIIDVREVNEYEEGHLPGIPLIPMNLIPSMAEKMDKSKSYILVCRSGRRSQNTALYLHEQGFENVRNYEGGMLDWDGEQEFGQQWVVKDPMELYR